MNSTPEQITSGDPEQILVIRFSSLGDLLLTAPALRALRRRFPQSHIDLLVAADYADAARLLPGPDRILTFDRSRGFNGLLRLRAELSRRYSILVDLQNSVRSAFLRATTLPTVWVKARRYRFRRWVLIRLKRNLYRSVIPVPLRYLDALAVIGTQDDDRGLQLAVPADSHAAAERLIAARQIDTGRAIIFCPGARHATKRWPAESWIELGRRLAGAGGQVVVVGSESETEMIRRIAQDIPGGIPLSGQEICVAAALMHRSAAVVSNDSGLMHLAAGLDRPLVAIFGPTVPEFGFYPFRSPARIFDQRLDCRPCSALGGRECPRRHFRCMRDTHPEAVAAAVLDSAGLLQRSPQ